MRITKPEVKAPKKFKKFGKLPGRPSELIRLALDDLKKAERTPGVTIDMDHWHHTTMDGDCLVCMAGAVMRARLPTQPHVSGPFDFGQEGHALLAVDNFRYGDLAEAFENLNLSLPHHFEDGLGIVEYDEDPPKFKRQMSQLATALEKEGY